MVRKRLPYVDGIYNTLTGVGAGKDTSFDVLGTGVLDYVRLREIYRHVSYARRACDLPVEDATSKGYTIPLEDGANDAKSVAWQNEQRRLKLDLNVVQQAKWARAFGTAYLLLITEDGSTPDKALDLGSLKRINQVVCLTADECRADSFGLLSGIGETFMDPVYYRTYLPTLVRNGLAEIPSGWASALSGTDKIHHTRIIRMIGRELTRDEILGHWTEGDSIIQAMFRELAQAVGVDNAAAILAAEMKLDVVKVPGLDAVAASDQREAFEERMSLLKRGKSLLNMIILGRDEEFESRQAPVSGFKDLGQQAKDALVAATGIPEPILFGKATSGMAGETGIEGETYMGLLNTLWRFRITPVYERLYTVIRAQKAGPYAGNHSVQFEVHPVPLREERPKDVWARRLMQAQIDSMYYAGGMGPIPKEYLQERFKAAGGWTFDLPPYDPSVWPTDMPEPTGGGGGEGAPENPNTSSPNTQGKNAPGQMPPDPLKVATPSLGGAAGVDARPTSTNTGLSRYDAEFPNPTSEDRKRRYKIPEAVKNNAKKAIEWKAEYGEAVQGGIDTGWRRARQLATETSISGQDVIEMAAWWARHRETSSSVSPEWKDEPWRDNGWIAGLIWGGNTADEWVTQARSAMGRTDAEPVCPIETQDIEANLANRQTAIDKAHYGPANPNEPGDYWSGKADRMNASVEEVSDMKCGNCAFFNVSDRMVGCIAKGVGEDAYDVIEAGQLGYCEAFDFKCAAERTCDAWVVGGPIREDGTMIDSEVVADVLSDLHEAVANAEAPTKASIMDMILKAISKVMGD
jgi:hypothetical protein